MTVSEETKDNKWHVFTIGLDKAYALGINGRYETDITKALSFNEKIDAIRYVEKYGFEKITTVRKLKKF